MENNNDETYSVYDVLLKLIGNDKHRLAKWYNERARDYELERIYATLLEKMEGYYGSRGIALDQAPLIQYK